MEQSHSLTLVNLPVPQHQEALPQSNWITEFQTREDKETRRIAREISSPH